MLSKALSRTTSFVAVLLFALGLSFGSSPAAAAPSAQTSPVPLDVVFVLDGSGSITIPNFELARDFAIRLAAACFQTDIQFGVVQFSTQGRTRTEIQLTTDKQAVTTALTNMVQIRGDTDIQEGLQFAGNELNQRGRPGSNRIAILLTDGLQVGDGDPIAEATTLKTAGISIFGIGVGNIDYGQLRSIASDPDANYVFTVNDFNALTSVLNAVAGGACNVIVDPGEPVRGNPAQVYAVQRPTANHVATPGSVVSYEVVVKNLGRGSAKTAYVTLPLTGAAEVLGATFSRPSAWVTEVSASSLKFETGPLGSRSDVVTATIRLGIKPGAAAGSTLTDRLTVSWRDGVSGGTSLSNLPIVVVGAASDHRATYTLEASTNSASAGTPFIFSSAVFAPKEPIGTWYNTPSGAVVAGPTFFAEEDGSLAVELDSSELSPGSYSFVFYGHWTEFTGVAAFAVK